MLDIMRIFICLSPPLSTTELRQLTRITEALLSMSGRVTMRGLSRWAGPGGSYRTVQRFFNTVLDWDQLQWLLIRTHLVDPDDVIVASGDHVVVTKAGKQTHGLDRFFSSLYGKTVPGLCFLSLSLISVKHRKSYPALMEQVEKPSETIPSAPAQAAKKKRQGQSAAKAKRHGGGRPKGSTNRHPREVELSPSLVFIQAQIVRLKHLVGDHLKLRYFLFDGELGHNDAMHMVRQVGMHLISKLRYDSALYLPYEGPYSGRGSRRKYGPKLDYHHLPSQPLKSTSVDQKIKTEIYQMSLRHKRFTDLLNVVIMVKTNLRTNKMAHVVLFSSDLTLGYETLIDYYRLRFQLEFNFRDAKQYWGLEDFMSIKARPVYNSANLAMFMVNVSYALIRPMREQWPAFSVNDLKAWFRGRKYVVETLKWLPEPPDASFIDHVVRQMAELGRVNHTVNPS
jgi:putative transposase